MSSKLHLVYVTDSGYLMQTRVAATSAALFADRPKDLYIHVFDCGLADDEWEAFERGLRMTCGPAFCLERHIIDLTRYQEFKFWHSSLGIYARLDIPDILRDADWCVYADGDTLFTSDPLELLSFQDDRYALLGHLDDADRSQADWHRARGLPWDSEHHICAGLILLNLKWFRANDGTSRCFDLLRLHPDIPFNDQDVLNIVCMGKVGLLPKEWGCFPSCTALADKVSCIHYTSEKPWEKPYGKYYSYTGNIRLWACFVERILGKRIWEISHYGLTVYLCHQVKTLFFECLFSTLNRLPFLAGRYSGGLSGQWSREKIESLLPPMLRGRKSVCFMLPGMDGGPVGGYKIVYEYANRLTARGWRVTMAYPLFGSRAEFGRMLRGVFCGRWKDFARRFWYLWLRREGPDWFVLDRRVRAVFPIWFGRGFGWTLPRETCFVATFRDQAAQLAQMRSAKRKFHFVQDGFDIDDRPESRGCGIRRIVIAEWLREELKRRTGEESAIIPNGLDFEYFQMSKPIEDRTSDSIAFLWHPQERKRSVDVVAALEIVRKSHPTISVQAFGAMPHPENLPDWISYDRKPDRARHNEVYNTAAIFVQASEQEGWGLTPCEAMQCGAAFVGTDVGGFRMFAKDGQTALLSPVRDPEKLAANICRLIEDHALRIRIAKAGHEYVKQFTWERAVEGMEGEISEK